MQDAEAVVEKLWQAYGRYNYAGSAYDYRALTPAQTRLLLNQEWANHQPDRNVRISSIDLHDNRGLVVIDPLSCGFRGRMPKPSEYAASRLAGYEAATGAKGEYIGDARYKFELGDGSMVIAKFIATRKGRK